MAKKDYLIGVDIGGTKMLIGLLDRSFKVRTSIKTKIKTEKGRKYFVKMLVSGIEEVLEQERVKINKVAAIGVGCPGMIKFPNGIIKLSPNISFLKNYPLQAQLARTFHRHVLVENDVNAGLYGEHQLGAAKGYEDVVGIFPGTGVGGALILGGELYRGSTGAAGEIGHTFLNLPSSFLHSGMQDTVENLIGRTVIASEAAILAARQKTPQLFKLAGTEVQQMKSNTLARAIRSGDKALKELISSKARVLGIAMANTVNLLNPELIVLGGGLIEALGSMILPEARQVMREYALAPVVKHVQVVQAKLGDDAIVIGASKLAYDTWKD